ncbi:MAG: FliG C-terminal domain-containing protein [Elusimicrobiota bacterium]
MVENNYYKAAVFLSNLPDEQCVEILRSFEEDDVEKICQEMLSLAEVNEETKAGIIKEFQETMKGNNSPMKAGAEYVQGILARVYGVRRSESMLSHMKEHSESKVDLDTLIGEIGTAFAVEEIKEEHPQVVAAILTSISYQKASTVVAALPEDMQCEVFRAMGLSKPMPADLANKIKQGLIQKLLKRKNSGTSFKKEGIQGSAEILSLLPSEKSRKIIESIKSKDQDLGISIESAIFSIDDLVKLEDRDVQKILAKADQNAMKLSLRLCAEETKEKVFKNMSERAAGMLRDDISVMAPQKRDVIIEAQQKLIDIIRKLDEAGEIKIPRPQQANSSQPAESTLV